ncbi:MAG: glycosyltransferase [Acidobacteriota bacterium]|nr:glycosyltransferase [Acidobacteriota bacterium]
MTSAVPLTIAIPTYERGTVLCDTIEHLLALDPRAAEIVIVDQTRVHPPDVAARLEAWERAGVIRVFRLEAPSIPRAMNTALREASNHRVLFLDDDIIPSPRLVASHGAAWTDSAIWAVAGQVLQPGETPAHFDETELRRGYVRDLEFRFTHDTACEVQNVMAGNLCVDRTRALAIGGFDERYTAVAYRFETDFALRLVAAGGRIRYEPAASIHHLKVAGGGVRMWGDHLTSTSPAHSMGDYYFARRHVPEFWRYAARRLRNNIATRFHLRHPWTIPGKLIGELRGLFRAFRLDQ